MTAPLNLRDYGCARVRRRLDSHQTGELSVDLSHEILEHLDRCPACRAESEARERLRASFRRVAALTPGPRDGFEEEVRVLVAKTPLRRSVPVPLLLAASLIVAAGIAAWLVVSGGRGPSGSRVSSVATLDPSVADFAALNHKNCARAATWPREAASAEAFTRSVDPSLGAAARAAAASLPGFLPVSAHECAHAGETIFHVILRRRGDDSRDGLVSVVVTRPHAALAARAESTSGIAAASRLGFGIAGARIPDGRFVLVVGSADERAATEMARTVVPIFAAAAAAL